jgi:hypothetical protein
MNVAEMPLKNDFGDPNESCYDSPPSKKASAPNRQPLTVDSISHSHSEYLRK